MIMMASKVNSKINRLNFKRRNTRKKTFPNTMVPSCTTMSILSTGILLTGDDGNCSSTHLNWRKQRFYKRKEVQNAGVAKGSTDPWNKNGAELEIEIFRVLQGGQLNKRQTVCATQKGWIPAGSKYSIRKSQKRCILP